MTKLKKSKKGNFRDIPEYIQAAVVLGFAILLVGTILFNFNNRVQTIDNSTIPDRVKATSADISTGVPQIYDYAFGFVFLVYFIFSLVMARLIPSSPKFIIIAIIYMIAMPVLAMVLGNIWDSFSRSSALSDVFNTLIFTTFMLDNLVILSLIYVGGVAIALYTKDD